MDNTREKLIEQAEDILAKWEFFYGQRAGRELWAEKPKDVQDKDIEAFNRDISVVRSAIANGVTVQKWIPVTERLPEDVYGKNRDKIAVLVCTKSGNVSQCVRCADCVLIADETFSRVEWIKNGKFYWSKGKDVTHWMPLPEPPKEW